MSNVTNSLPDYKPPVKRKRQLSAYQGRLVGLVFLFDVDQVPENFVDLMFALSWVKEVEGPLINGVFVVTVDFKKAVAALLPVPRSDDAPRTCGLRIELIYHTLRKAANRD